MSPNTFELEIVCLKAWWKCLQDEENFHRPLRDNGVQKEVENRISGQPFASGDLKRIYSTIKDWVKGDISKPTSLVLP